MSTSYVESQSSQDIIPEAFCTRLEQQLRIGSNLSSENKQLREQILYLKAYKDRYSDYANTYNRMISTQDQLIPALLEEFTQTRRPSSRSEGIPIDPALTVNYSRDEATNPSSFVSTVCEVSQETDGL
ncbi:hypothetical protein FLAG1_11891 [Fusarium langsethiae]|uniref:Uncharacterized protein n=1 Tax=Fusarium langsethiae TaxID=179993 RepID=A0A0M9ELW7_FUSLA|nr:hypothetical protein FLAG1_11891 [Fusarium langsethiae]